MRTTDAPSAGRARGRRITMVASSLALVVALSGCRYNVAVFGDVPYETSQEDDYERLIADVNADTVAFSSHVGDIQSSSTQCSDAIVERNVNWFDQFDEPLIYTPGDNEWTDCSDPLLRLDRLRELVFRGDGATSRGARTRSLLSQDSEGYPENATWRQGKVTWVSLHIVGSSDNSGDSDEWAARRAADIAWLDRAFTDAKARGDRGVVVLAHSGLRFERAEGDKGRYESMFDALRTQTQGFAGQVLYVHGDGHTFRDDRPMVDLSGQTVANFRRVEVYGDNTVRWVKIAVDDATSTVFTVTSPPTP